MTDIIEDFEFEGWGLIPVKKNKSKFNEPLFQVYFSKAGTAKGKFLPEAVEAMKLKPESVKKDDEKVYKTVNLASTSKGKIIFVFNSTATGTDNTAKKILSSNYLIDLSAKEVKMIFEANGLIGTDGILIKEDCYFSMAVRSVKGLGDVFILSKSDIPVEKKERTDEQIARTKEISDNAKADHTEFKKFATKNLIDTSGKAAYMGKFQAWKKEKALVKKVKAKK